MENNEELPEIQNKTINGVEISNLDYAKIAMVCDYLILDRFHDISSFFRLEKCFGPFFSKENSDFLPDVFKEICGEKKKYISFARLILAYCKWKTKSSTNENFNRFMNLVFGDMVKTQDEVIGKLVEGGRIFSTRNTRGRKVISRFSVLTDEIKNKLEGFHIQYDDVFDTVLSTKKARDDITLEMNFQPNGKNIRDRDGISHIGGKYSVTKGIIKFFIFKCRSGKTFYIGDEKEEEEEQFQFFLFGTSSCQLKSVRIELVNEQLIYFEPKFQPSLRVNQKLICFEDLDEKYINENILNAPLIFEENEMQNMTIEQLEETNTLIIPCISDDAFIDKKALIEPLCGKDFNEIYKTFLISQNEQLNQEKEELKKKLYEKTIMRKHLLKVYFNKFKIKENIFVLQTQKPAEPRVNMDKFLCKVKAYKKKVNKKIELKKEELEKKYEEDIWDDGEDWVEDAKSEATDNIVEEIQNKSEKFKEEGNIKEEQPKKEEINGDKEKEESNIEENVDNKNETKNEIKSPKIDEIKIEIEPPKLDENIIKFDTPKVEINKVEIKGEEEIKGDKAEELNLEIPGEEKLLIEVSNEKDKVSRQDDKIILKANRPKKLLKKSLNKLQDKQEETKDEKTKFEETKLNEVKPEESQKAEIKVEEPKIEEIKKVESKGEEINKDEIKKVEVKNGDKKEEENNKINTEKNESIKNEDNNLINKKIKEESVKKENIHQTKKEEPPKKKKGFFCLSF